MIIWSCVKSMRFLCFFLLFLLFLDIAIRKQHIWGHGNMLWLNSNNIKGQKEQIVSRQIFIKPKEESSECQKTTQQVEGLQKDWFIMSVWAYVSGSVIHWALSQFLMPCSSLPPEIDTVYSVIERQRCGGDVMMRDELRSLLTDRLKNLYPYISTSRK